MLVATIAAPVLALFVGVALDRLLEQKPKVVAYFAHTSAFTIRSDLNPPQVIHTHSIVIRNVGRRSASNVRVRHVILPPNFNVYPDTEYRLQPLPEGGSEIIFPALVSGEQVSVSYLYFLLFSSTKSTAGFGTMRASRASSRSCLLLRFRVGSRACTDALWPLAQLRFSTRWQSW
jgi:hypothetical protein